MLHPTYACVLGLFSDVCKQYKWGLNIFFSVKLNNTHFITKILPANENVLVKCKCRIMITRVSFIKCSAHTGILLKNVQEWLVHGCPVNCLVTPYGNGTWSGNGAVNGTDIFQFFVLNPISKLT